MKNLIDVFNKTTEVDEELIKEYFERNERKKDDEKWLKENGTAIKVAMQKSGRLKEDYGDIRVSLSIPNASKFDMDKVLDFLLHKVEADIYHKCTKTTVDEEALTKAIEDGEIDLEELKEAAWVESKGSPRLTISKKKAGD